MSGPDRDAESSYANLAREVTGLPLVGMTLAAGDTTWSAPALEHRNRQRRRLHTRRQRPSRRRPPRRLMERRTQPPTTGDQPTGPHPQRLGRIDARPTSPRRRILVVGAGSVGLDIVVRLAASGLCRITIMDFDIVKAHNLDRPHRCHTPRRPPTPTQDPRRPPRSRRPRPPLPTPQSKFRTSLCANPKAYTSPSTTT